MVNKNIFLFGFILNCVFGCGAETNNENNQGNNKESEAPLVASDMISNALSDCIYKGDTTLANGNSVKYINMDSFYTIKISINGYDTLLDYKFDCNTAYKNVPRYFFYSENSLFLTTNTSPNYRHLVACELVNGHFFINHYMTERPEISDKDFCAYKIISDKSKLYATGIFNLQNNYRRSGKLNKSTLHFSLPETYQNYLIDHSEIHDKSISVYFTNNKKLDIPIK